MNDLLEQHPLVWAAQRAPDRVVAIGVLGVRPLLYVGEGVAGRPPVIEDLRVVAVGAPETPIFHAETGLYGFLRLPSGPRRIEISDPARRFMPWATVVQVPDRAAIRAALERGAPSPSTPRPTLIDLALRRAPSTALPPGLTAVWGVVRETTGKPVPLARISCATAGGGEVVAYSTRDGAYVLVLPAEKPSSLAEPPKFVFPRALRLHAPKKGLAAAMAGPSFVGALPADLDDLDLIDPAGPFLARDHRLRNSAGAVLAGPHPDLPVQAGQRTRWDIELLP